MRQLLTERVLLGWLSGLVANDYWPGGNVFGKHIRFSGETRWRETVGVAKNANYTSWGEPPQLCGYVPLDQNYSDATTLYVRSQGDPRQILRSVQREIHNAGPQILSTGMRTSRETIDGGLFQAKMGVVLLSVFGLLALALASIGL